MKKKILLIFIFSLTFFSDQVLAYTRIYNFTDYATFGHSACEIGNLPANTGPSDPYSQCQNPASSGNYLDISNSDDEYWVTAIANSNNQYDIQIFRFNISEDPTDIVELDALWEGHSDEIRNNYDLSAFIWNAQTGSWELIGTSSSGSTSDVTWTKQITTNISNYVDEAEGWRNVSIYARFKNYRGFSCPFVYSFDGKQYHFEHEAYPFSVIKSSETTTFDRLKYLKNVDGKYFLQIREELEERSWVNNFDLYVVDHPKHNSFVMPDINGNVHTIENLIPPISCFEKNGDDCLDLVKNFDEKSWKGDLSIDLNDESTWRNWIVLTFPKPKNREEAKLFLYVMKQRVMTKAWEYYIDNIGENYWSFWQKILSFPPFSKLFNDAFEKAVDLNVEVWDGKTWEKQAYIKAGREGWNEFLISLNISGLKEKKLKIRLSSTTGFYEINYVGIDYSEDEPLKVHKLTPLSALKNEKDDVREELAEKDEKYVTLVEGDKIDLIYDAIPVYKDWRRDFVIAIGGYYNFINFKDRDFLGFVRGILPWLRSLFKPSEIPKIVYSNIKSTNSLYTDYVEVRVITAEPSFNLTLPGLDPIESSKTKPGTLSTPIEFNASHSTDYVVNPCVSGYNCLPGYKQDSSTPIFIFTNTGNVAEKWNISLSEPLPTYIKLFGDTDSDPAGATEITTSGWVVSDNIPIGSSVEVWLWANFTQAPPGEFSVELLHESRVS